MNSAHGPCACAARSRSNATSCSAWWHSRSIKYSASRSSGPRRPERRPLRPREHRENSPRSMNFARGSKGTAKSASRGDGSGAPAPAGARPLLAQAEKESPADDGWRRRIDARFTSLRGYAALAVMLAHYQYLGFLAAAPVLKDSAQLELMLFFFLSSFLLSHSLASDPNWTKVSIFPVASYAINRVFRIFPLLFIVVTFCWRWSLAFFPASTTLAQALALSVTLGKVPSVLWTIPVEVTFYVFLPVCLRHFLRLTRSSLGAGALTALFAAWCVCIAIARHH